MNDSIVVCHDILSKILEKHAPLVEKYIKTSKKPRWNLGCQNARRRKRVLERAFWKNKSLENKSKFYAACKQANKVYGIEREKYFKEKLAYYQRWSPRRRTGGHILKSLVLASKFKSLALATKPLVLENCPVLGSRTALFFEPSKFSWKTPKTSRKICEAFFCFSQLKNA